MKVSIFKNFNQVEENLDLAIILEQIKTGKYKAEISELRELLNQDKAEEYNEQKRSLPAFTPSGLFKGGRKLEFLKEYSGCMVLDLDKLNQEQLNNSKLKIREIPYTYSCFISPSGQGLKILVKVFSRPVYHKKVFEQIKEYYEKKLTLPIDPSGKDITRLCFISFDEDIFINTTASVFQPEIYIVEEDIENVVKKIEQSAIDLTDNYNNWLKIGFALVDAIGEEGRSYFQRISSFYPGYKKEECDEQFDKCLKSSRTGITIATLFYLAKDNGIDISKLRSLPKSIKKDIENITAYNDTNSKNNSNGSKKQKKKDKNQVKTIEDYISKNYQLRFNTVTSKVEIRKIFNANPETDQKDNLIEQDHFIPITDYLENSILCEILKNNLKCTSTLLHSILYSDFSYFFDPFREYFIQLPLWDGKTDYIQMLAETVTTTTQDLWYICLKKWLVAAVASVLDFKTVNHTAIILSGPQGIGKTTWMLNLCPPELDDYIFSGTINPNNKDTLIHLSECMFINMDELENMNRFEIGAFKELITKSNIRLRRAYGHNNEVFSRRASFMGSVNSIQFLTDSTGSRRFLCFEILSIDYNHDIDLRMVYAQAYDLFQQGFKFYFDKDDINAIMQSNEQFQINTAEQELLVTYFEKVPLSEANNFLSATQILNRISERTHANFTNSPGAVIRLGKALKKFDFERRRSNGIFLWAVQEKSSLTSSLL